ncbi:hypothetical protein M3Y98_01054400 [Aphelenchoides besseyi]|nr:hypothetical protein M3Y98_01054400 [Aphelenchoides besseyi]KAI6209766.1 hypothetical protein M3Y96_00255500 [Aphelenchoides besseyi]
MLIEGSKCYRSNKIPIRTTLNLKTAVRSMASIPTNNDQLMCEAKIGKIVFTLLPKHSSCLYKYIAGYLQSDSS